ncbi:MAG: ABC transporter ATP-binding protein [Actinobacteria bacterium]|nr:ABC transporter ATP-binding protein [Actinomycetota bacterium]MBW3650550.1 ABC transporter ATP-binding protein [Actinomycetota bacterium]
MEVADVSKWFGAVVALSEVSCRIGPGITALLGPNGAGKSTLLRVLCGLTAPSRGEVRILGRVPRRDVGLARHMGLVPQQEALFDRLTARQFVALAAKLHRVHQPEAAVDSVLGQVALDPRDPRPLRTYSKGMRQRVKVAQALVHEPEVLILDEPLEGLDPRQRLGMINLLRQVAAEGRTVVVASHVLEEVERFGSRVLVIAQGRLAAEGDFRAIRELMDDRPHRLRIRTDRPRPVAAGLISSGAATGAWVQGDDVVVVDTVDVALFRHRLAPVAREQGARLVEVVALDDDLESVFRYLVGRR